jgi:biotin operon repressor
MEELDDAALAAELDAIMKNVAEVVSRLKEHGLDIEDKGGAERGETT